MTKHARVARIVLLPLAAVALLCTIGCPSQPGNAPALDDIRPQDVMRGAQATTDGNKIIAYVNVTSGCQEETVAALDEAARQYAGRVSIETVDFGDGGEGTARWRADGLKCMAIVFGGKTAVAWDHGQERRAADFVMPPGFNWTIDDLEQAISAFADGRLAEATDDELLAAASGEPVALDAAAEMATAADGAEVARLTIAGRQALEVRVAAGDVGVLARAEQAAEALNRWSAEVYLPAQLKISDDAGEIAILAGEFRVLVVTAADAEAARVSIDELAKQWHEALRFAAVAANAAEPAGQAN